MSGLIVNNLSKEFPTRGEPVSVLRDVTLNLPAGENLAIVGPSGSGKSTLLHILGTLDYPSSGSINLNGQDPFVLNENQLADFRNGMIGFIFQDHHLLPQLSALENVLVPTITKRSRDQEILERAKTLLDRVGLADRLDHRPSELSGGERQRVAVARALICRPMLLLADEPTGNLDRTNAAAVADLLLEVQRHERAMLIVVTHSQDIAVRLKSQVELNDGRLANGSGVLGC